MIVSWGNYRVAQSICIESAGLNYPLQTDLETTDGDLKFWLEQRHGLERCVVVGDSRFLEWGDELDKRLTSVDVKSFRLEDRDGAWKWLQR